MSEEHSPPPTDPVARALRASDEDRERLVDELNEHAVAGRLDTDELENRLKSAYSARTTAELDALRGDLPVTPRQTALAHAQRRSQLTRRMLQQAGGSLGAFRHLHDHLGGVGRPRPVLAGVGADRGRGDVHAQRLGAVRTCPRPRRCRASAGRAGPAARGAARAALRTPRRAPRARTRSLSPAVSRRRWRRPRRAARWRR
jgi:hypothetical protein